MKSAVLFNGIGAIVIIASVILHIVCIATPHFSGLLMNANTVKEISSAFSDSSADERLGSSDSMSQFSEEMTFGLWKMCIHASTSMSMDVSACINWGTTSRIMGTPITITIGDWIHGVQAMAIIGSLLAGSGAILAVINLIIESKGDRQRYLYLIISACCISGGIAMLIGDIIMGAKYKTILESVIKAMPIPNNIDVPATLVDLLKDQMYLSWGFALDIVSSAMALLSGIVIIVGGRMAMNSNGVI